MQKISVDLIRLAVSAAAIGVVADVAVQRGFHHGDHVGYVKVYVAPPMQVRAISVGAPALCWTIEGPIDASTPQEARTERPAIAQTCSSVAPTLRRLSEPQRRLASAS